MSTTTTTTATVKVSAVVITDLIGLFVRCFRLKFTLRDLKLSS